MSKYDNHHHNADPAYAEPSLKKDNANEKAGGWIAIAVVAVIAAGLLAWLAGAFDADNGEEVAGLTTAGEEVRAVERRVVETEAGLPATAPRNEAAIEVAPTDGAAVVIPQENDGAAVIASDGAGGTEVITMPQLVTPKLAVPGEAEYVGPVDDKATVVTAPATE